MDKLVGLAIFAAFAYTGWEFYKKYKKAQLATPAGLQAITEAAKALPLTGQRPFNLDPTLVG